MIDDELLSESVTTVTDVSETVESESSVVTSVTDSTSIVNSESSDDGYLLLSTIDCDDDVSIVLYLPDGTAQGSVSGLRTSEIVEYLVEIKEIEENQFYQQQEIFKVSCLIFATVLAFSLISLFSRFFNSVM